MIWYPSYMIWYPYMIWCPAYMTGALLIIYFYKGLVNMNVYFLQKQNMYSIVFLYVLVYNKVLCKSYVYCRNHIKVVKCLFDTNLLLLFCINARLAICLFCWGQDSSQK